MGRDGARRSAGFPLAAPLAGTIMRLTTSARRVAPGGAGQGRGGGFAFQAVCLRSSDGILSSPRCRGGGITMHESFRRGGRRTRSRTAPGAASACRSLRSPALASVARHQVEALEARSLLADIAWAAAVSGNFED